VLRYRVSVYLYGNYLRSLHGVQKNWLCLEHIFFFSGIQTSQDARFYALSTKFKPFSNKDKPLVIQFSVKHEQNIDCGGGYAKIFDCKLDPKDMHGETPYELMFGPDICGPGTKKVHVIFSYKGKNLLINKDIRCKDDVYTHLYTLIVKPDNTYEVRFEYMFHCYCK
jgi:calreticulin